MGITEKKCFKCCNILPIQEFYVHKKMPDGHLNKCKKCTIKDTSQRIEELKKNPEWIEKERERNREKYHRLGYKDKNKPSTEKKKNIMKRYRQKFPEKYLAAKYTEIFLTKEQGFHLHHWSYNQVDWLDVIKLSIKEHNLIHRYLIYNKKKMIYSTIGEVLLDTKNKHLEFIQKLLGKNVL